MKAYALLRQRGNTLTGLIIGLVVGLAIAVAVALLITRSSTPFTNKGVKDRPDQPLIQLQDPNKPLFGSKDAAKEANKEFAKEPGNGQPAEAPAAPAPANSVNIPPPGTAPVAARPVEPKPEVKPAANPGNAPAVTETTDDKYAYFLQAGAFKDQADAESARAKLALLGFEAKVTEKSSDTGTMFRVRVGPYPNAETMNKMRSRLSDNGVDVAVVRIVK